MRIKFLMRLLQIELNNASSKNQRIIWQVLAENKFEIDMLEYISRYLEMETINEVNGVLAVLDSELIYHSIFLNNNFRDPDFLLDLATGYIFEKGGVFRIKPIHKALKKIQIS
jgi:hypothetical protein